MGDKDDMLLTEATGPGVEGSLSGMTSSPSPNMRQPVTIRGARGMRKFFRGETSEGNVGAVKNELLKPD
jgi:hypothetical protein